MAIETPARIAVIGAGPVGLEAALYARYLGYDVDVFERGQVADHASAWGHVRLFTCFGDLRSTLGLAALRAQDPNWRPPADHERLTACEWVDKYLLPLSRSDLLADSIHDHSEVVVVGRDGPLKYELTGDDSRGDHDFRLLVRSTNPDDHGREHTALADVVIDATGTFGNHRWLGHGGIPALGEIEAEPFIEYGLPDVLGAARERYAHRNTLLVGGGYSAATTLAALAELATQAPDTWVTWLLREPCESTSPPLPLIANDPLVERDRLARLAAALAADDANHVTLLSGTTVESVAWHADLERFSVRLRGRHAGELEFDRIVANVGYRPDHALSSELQVEVCPATLAQVGIASRLAEAGSSSGLAGEEFGTAMLLLREPDFYLLGAKSYGVDSRFFMSDGLAQIRALFAILGDRADLDLYATMTGLY
jgi:thioredoxin reductase